MIDLTDVTYGRSLWSAGVLLVAAGLLVLGVMVTRRRRRLAASGIGVALRWAALGVAAWAFLQPLTLRVEEEPGTLLILSDGSRSVDEAARRDVVTRAWSGAAGPLPPRKLVISFGERATREPNPADHLESDALASDPRPALGQGLLLPELGGASGRLVLVTDGHLPPPQGVLACPELRPVILPVLARQGRVTLGELALAEVPDPEKPLALALRGQADGAAVGEVTVWLDDVVVRQWSVSLAGGSFEVPFTVPAPGAGSHVVAAHLAVLDQEPLDDWGSVSFQCEAAPTVLVLAPEAGGFVEHALRTQGYQVEWGDPEAEWAPASVWVLDRVPADALSDPLRVRRLKNHVEAGGGLLHFPSEARGEMYDSAARPFLDLLPLVGLEPPPPVVSDEETPDGGSQPHDAEPKETEKRLAPSLGMLLVIDASSSMGEDGKLVYAKEAAIAAVETLHPEDFLGVVVFNTQPSVLIELTPAGKGEYFADRIARIKAEGGTAFGPALELARDLMVPENLGVRHIIFLSDGASKPFPLKALVTGMAKEGITLSTVACGLDSDESMLSDLAAWGQGKFHPAFSVKEVPQVFTIEAERVIASSGARRRPAADGPSAANTPALPRPDDPPDTPKAMPVPARPFRSVLPAPYTVGIAPHDMAGIFGLHPTRTAPGAWLTWADDEGAPVLAHWQVGYGRVVSFALPLQGEWGPRVLEYPGTPALLGQIIRFLQSDRRPERFSLSGGTVGRSVFVQVFDQEARAVQPGLRLVVQDARGQAVPLGVEETSPGVFRLNPGPEQGADGLVLRVDHPEGCVPFHVSLPRLVEIAGEGAVSSRRLQEWADALGGTVALGDGEVIVVGQRTHREPVDFWWRGLWVVLPIVALDLLLRRVSPGRRAA